MNVLERVKNGVKSLLSSTYDCSLLVVLLAALTYLPGYGTAYVFWDENYHITSAERYIEGIAQFEAHPPLGKLLIAAGEVIMRPNQQIDKHILTTTKNIPGDQVPKGFAFNGMRVLPSLFAVLGAFFFFNLMFALTENRLASLLLSGLYVFENAFIVHFRAAHLDSFQLCFSLAAFWYFVKLWRAEARASVREYGGLAAIIALAIMVKINSVLLLLLLPTLFYRDCKRNDGKIHKTLADFSKKTLSSVGAMLAVTFMVFWVSAMCGREMPDPESSTGRDDIPHMSTAYKKFLINHEWLTPMVVAHITVDYFKFMSQSHAGVPKLDNCKPEENGSHPMHWPLMDKTINYRWDAADGKTGYVQLVGNPVSWGLGLAAVIVSFGLLISRRVFNAPVRDEKTYQLIEIFTLLYLVFMGLHLWLGAQRVMYLYHYFIGLTISYALIALNVVYLADVRPFIARQRNKIVGILAALILISFAFMSPLTYHLKISKSQCEQRNWLFNVVKCV